MRYFIAFAYCGKAYCGWQRQPHMLSVQEVLEEKMSLLLHQNIILTGAGRTDSGVHARQMYAHFDCLYPIERGFVARLNSFLPADIAVKKLLEVTSEAHARFDATARSYEYHISLQKDPFTQALAYYLHYEPNLQLMNQACQELLKHTNFQCFSKVKTDVKTFNCHITHAQWVQHENHIVFYITADRFLRNMVRAIVGTMLLVGQNKLSLNEFKAIIESKNRSKAGFSVPAHGLFLTQVSYPDGYFGKAIC